MLSFMRTLYLVFRLVVSMPTPLGGEKQNAIAAGSGLRQLIDPVGLPFVPAGFYTRDDLNVREFQNGFNSVIRIGASPGGRSNSTDVESWLRRSDEVGTSVFLDVSHLVRAIWRNENGTGCEELWSELQATARLAAMHRSVVAWYLADEPDNGSDGVRVAVVQKAASSLRQVDSAATGRQSRPILICLDTAVPWEPESNRHYHDYTSIADVLLTDPYPITGGGSGPAAYLTGDVFGAVTTTFRNLRNATDKPIMLVAQATGGEVVYARTPSVREARLMAYASLIAGGTGIMNFHLENPVSPGCDGTAAASHRSDACSVNGRERSPLSPNLWNELRRLALELAELSPALLSKITPPIVHVDAEGSSVSVSARAFFEDTQGRMDPNAGGLILIVVNHERDPGTFAVKISKLDQWQVKPDSTWQLLFEDRVIPSQNTSNVLKLQDIVDGFSTRAYRLEVELKSAFVAQTWPRVHPNNTVFNPSFEQAIGGGGTPDGINILVGNDVDAAILMDPRDSVDGLHCLRMHSPTGPDGLFVWTYGGGGGTESATWYHPGHNYTLSVWARAVANGGKEKKSLPQLKLGIDPGFGDLHQLPYESSSWEACNDEPANRACIEPRLTETWAEYSLNVSTPSEQFPHTYPWVFFQQRGAGVVFVDLLQLIPLGLKTDDSLGSIEVTATLPPVVALNDSTPGTRAYFPAMLAWAGDTLILAVNTQSDDIHDAGMRGRAVASLDGRKWQEIAQPLSPWQLETCCLPLEADHTYLAFSYDLRRTSAGATSTAFAHALGLQSSGPNNISGAPPIKQVAVRNVSFHFIDPLFQPAIYRAVGCPQSPDSPCNQSTSLALPTKSFAFQNTGNIVAAAHPQSSKRLLTTLYGVYAKDWPMRDVATDVPQYPPVSNYSIAVFASENGGQTWHYTATAAGRSAHASAAHFAGVCAKGASENHMVRLHDGSLFLVHRVANDAYDLCFTTSTEDGKDWVSSQPLTATSGKRPWGVAPRLLLLPNNVLALTTGRPGLMMWTSAEVSSATAAGNSKWHAFNLAAAHNRLASGGFPKFLSNCSRYGQHNCTIPGGFNKPGRAGLGSTTSYTGLTMGKDACLGDTCTVLVSYDWLANGWQPIPSKGPSNLIFVMSLQVRKE
eukprot:SAG31_NODE_3442_length_4265_cov_3.475516_1_plen_1132_part_00